MVTHLTGEVLTTDFDIRFKWKWIWVRYKSTHYNREYHVTIRR
ncbi:hypothetical protein VPHF99_0289 [Vibrio phage F99]|nr:hypothetical protein MYOV056v2_p0242 [Vibrio phage 184E37.3a]QZI90062.1 hypothetical protein MYOV057v1_p0147 [Vibrio phage 184E37.1]